jgi:hypothetical protein
MPAKQLPLQGIAYLNLRARGYGLIRAGRGAVAGCLPVVQLAIAREHVGHWPSQAEYARYWNLKERTAQRHWAQFRDAFPGEETPERLAKLIFAEYQGRLSEDCVFTEPAPAELQPA